MEIERRGRRKLVVGISFILVGAPSVICGLLTLLTPKDCPLDYLLKPEASHFLHDPGLGEVRWNCTDYGTEGPGVSVCVCLNSVRLEELTGDIDRWSFVRDLNASVNWTDFNQVTLIFDTKVECDARIITDEASSGI